MVALRPDSLDAGPQGARRRMCRLDDLRREDPEAFSALTMLVAAAYLTEPRVQRLLRVPRACRRRPRATRTPIRASCASSSVPCASAVPLARHSWDGDAE